MLVVKKMGLKNQHPQIKRNTHGKKQTNKINQHKQSLAMYTVWYI